ncbi:UNVERIFIED_CONTAM: hypothetical protein RKD43_001307 [Streptomyces graminofaciens]
MAPDEPVRHVLDHAGAGEDAGEHSGGEDHAGDVQDVVGVGRDACLLVRHGGEVDGQGEGRAEQEQHRDRQQLHDHGGEKGQRQTGVEPVQLGPQRRAVRVEALETAVLERGFALARGTVVRSRPGPGALGAGRGSGGCRGVLAATAGLDENGAGLGLERLVEREVPEALALTPAEDVREDEHEDESGAESGDHRHEDVGRVQLERGRGAGGGTAPRQGVHDAVRRGGDAGQHDQAHLQALVERIHRRDRDHEGRRAVAVERDDGGEHRRADHDAQRVRLAEAQDAPHDRVEQPDVDHHAEVDDGEHQHRRRGGEVPHAFEDVVPELRTLPDGDAEECGNQDQRRDRRHLLRHDQDQEGRDHGEAEDCQHGDT